MLKPFAALLLGASRALPTHAFAERLSLDAYKSEKNRIAALPHCRHDAAKAEAGAPGKTG